MLFRVLYSSRAIHPRGHLSDLDILRSAQSFNAEHNITGFLFRSNVHFFQILEGAQDTLDGLMGFLHQDPRHAELHVHLSYHVNDRLFDNWAMGYGDLTETDTVRIHGLLTDSKAKPPEAIDVLRDIAQGFV